MAHVTFIHGIGNKPEAEALLNSWKSALAASGGLDLDDRGVTSSMVYWADFLYGSPAPVAGGEESLVESPEGLDAEEMAGLEAVDMSWLADAGPKEKAIVAGLAVQVGAKELGLPSLPGEGELEGIPLPGFLKRRLMETFLRDVHHYLFNTRFSPRPGESFKIQDVIRKRTLKILGDVGSAPHVVVSHSMGTVITYDCLKRVPGCPRVDGYITLGSPLGLDEVQGGLKPGWSRPKGFPDDRLAGKWVNIYDRLDPVVGFDPKLANDFEQDGREVIRDIHEPSSGTWRHSISKYLGGARMRSTLGRLLGL